MAIELKQNLKLSQQLVMTPQLQQAIKLLQVTRFELVDVIAQEIEENPLLEIEDDENTYAAPETLTETDSVFAMEGEKPVDSAKELMGDGDGKEDFDWGNYLEDYAVQTLVRRKSDDEETSWDNFLTKAQTLIEYLMWQLKLTPLSIDEFSAGEFIIMSLDEDGYLRISIDEIAREVDCPTAEVESALTRVQSFDPPGVAARDLKECLLLQAENINADMVVKSVIENCLKDLELRNYSQIAKKVKRSEKEVMLAIDVIRKMNPKPGSAFSEDKAYPVVPDVSIIPDNDGYRIIINDDGIPRLRINTMYQEMIGNTKGEFDKSENKKYISEQMQAAKQLIKSIEQRQSTIYKVTESIVKCQKDFFDKGVGQLKPLILRDIAMDIGMHESTISRVVSNKYALTPQGTYLLKYFFSGSISTSDGEMMASTAVKDEIRKILLVENQLKPYNDSQIAALLKDKGINLARRTVAKYREMMNVLPSSHRKKFR